MRRLAAATALIAVLSLAAPLAADAATRHVVRGAGWGHGIGMSQYGAYGFAKNGRTYRQILSHYYRGTDLSQASTRTIRVLLMTNKGEISFSGASQAGTRRLDPAKSYRARLRGSGVQVRTSGGKRMGTFPAPLRIKRGAAGIRLAGTAIGGKVSGRYRGGLELRPSSGGGLTVVNPVPLDHYIQGVVPKESPSSWPAEALKAQAVAARSYALATDAGGPVFDQYPDVRSQVYRGMDEEAASTNAAVQATRGEVLRYDGEVATTFFFSTSGGHTENVENVFYGAAPKPYLRGVDDPFDSESPRHRWRFEYSQRQLDAKLGDWVKGSFRRIVVLKRGVSPRIVSADVVGSRGSTRVSGASLRARLGLYDTWVNFTRIDSTGESDPDANEEPETPPADGTSQGGVSPSSVMRWLFGAHERSVWGAFQPAPKNDVVAVERRSDGRWRLVARARLNSSGAYRAVVQAPGAYRVRSGRLAGPVVRIR